MVVDLWNMKQCANHYQKCEREVSGPRKKFCSDSCKYWYNSIKKDRELHLPPVKKRTQEYFSMVVGSERAGGRGQGKRVGHMVKGGMSAMIYSTVEAVVLFNRENVERHFKGIPGYEPHYLKLGDGTTLTRNQAFERLAK